MFFSQKKTKKYILSVSSEVCACVQDLHAHARTHARAHTVDLSCTQTHEFLVLLFPPEEIPLVHNTTLAIRGKVSQKNDSSSMNLIKLRFCKSSF